MDLNHPETALAKPSDDAAPSSLRASDQERDQVAGALGEALASGRLTTAEHAERIEAAYAARTLGELAPLTSDLPATHAASAPTTAAIENQHVTAVFSKVNRSGRWVAGRHTVLKSTFGALIVDLSSAVLPGREIVLEANAFCGKVIVTVPRNARIIDEGGVLFGKRWVAGDPDDADREADADGPVIRVTGQVRFGKVVIWRSGSQPRWPWRSY